MKSKRTGFYPSKESIRIIETSAKELLPEEESLLKWYNLYVSTHKVDIAMDLDIIRDMVPKNNNILEFGSIPLLLTNALANCNYNISGCVIAPERYSSTIMAIGIKVF